MRNPSRHKTIFLLKKIVKMSIESFTILCRRRKWEDAERMLHQDPSTMWTRDVHNIVGAYYVVLNDNIALLTKMYDTIISLDEPSERKEQLLRDTFERADHRRVTPIFTISTPETLLWMIEHCPSKEAILEFGTYDDDTVAHDVAARDCINVLELIARRSPSGIRSLMRRNEWGMTPISYIERGKYMGYFSPRKISSLGLENELDLLDRCNLFGSDTQSLVTLMLGIVKQNTEVLLYRLQVK